MDSVVLLHLLHTLAPRFGWRLSALHVHHGISPNADSWANFCADLCARHDIPLRIERVNIVPLRDELGIEAAARKLRHAEFARQECDFVALAHHADDQAETLLLQLLRGAGVKGAAAMPMLKLATVHAPATVRPLLNIPRSALLVYATQHALRWVEDESNADDRYPRNFLRHRVCPVLEQRFPAYRDTLARSAGHFAEASELLDELAREDARAAVVADRLSLAALNGLSAARAKNLLRHFLSVRGAPFPDASRLEEMLRQLREVRHGAQVQIIWGGWELRHYRDGVYVFPALSAPAAFEIVWTGEADVVLPAPCGKLHFEPATGAGLSLAKLREAGILIRTRAGGGAIQTHAAGPHHSLKNLFQEHGVAPWLRNVMPLLYCGAELICVPGVANAAAFQAQRGEQGMLVSWRQLHYDASK